MVRVRPHVVFHELHPRLLEILTQITKRLPILLPLLCRVLHRLCKVGEIAFVCLYRLLCALQLQVDFLEIFPLDKGRLGGVGVDAHTIRLILFARFVDVGLLLLFGLELLLDASLEHLLVVQLPRVELCRPCLKICANLLSKGKVKPGLSVCLSPDGIQ